MRLEPREDIMEGRRPVLYSRTYQRNVGNSLLLGPVMNCSDAVHLGKRPALTEFCNEYIRDPGPRVSP